MKNQKTSLLRQDGFQTLLASLVCILGGLIAGPGIACMHDCILRALRDNLDDWWYSWPVIIVLFALNLAPIALVLLFINLSGDEKKNKAA